jgi:hypothetical protein
MRDRPKYTYTFTHVDGRTFTTGDGSYQAMSKVLGQPEADRLLNTQDETEWVDLSRTNRAEFRVCGELVGIFTKNIVTP